MSTYKVLSKQIFSVGVYSLVPIRLGDRHLIMKWRNEQIYHLRQSQPLTKADQDTYFKNVITKLFDQDYPGQILFSYLENGKCIGYGGLVHINPEDKNAEISFLMDTTLEEIFFLFHWQTYLWLIEKVAFEELKLHKIFTYAFDLRPKLYGALESWGYQREARLNEHSFFEGEFIDVLIHSKTRKSLYLRNASISDLDITYAWLNDSHTREYSFNQRFITFGEHASWFTEKINDANCIYKLLVKGNEPVGSIRIDLTGDEGLINYLIAPDHIRKGYGKEIINKAIFAVIDGRPDIKLLKGRIKSDNLASIRIFEKFGFEKAESNEVDLEYTMNISHGDREYKNR